MANRYFGMKPSKALLWMIVIQFTHQVSCENPDSSLTLGGEKNISGDMKQTAQEYLTHRLGAINCSVNSTFAFYTIIVEKALVRQLKE